MKLVFVVELEIPILEHWRENAYLRLLDEICSHKFVCEPVNTLEFWVSIQRLHGDHTTNQTHYLIIFT